MASTEPRVIGSNYVKTTKTIELNGLYHLKLNTRYKFMI